MTSPIVEFQGVSKRFEYMPERPQSLKELVVSVATRRYFKLQCDTKTVLDNVSFKIHPGELVAFMGRNGTGKSTLLRVLCGIYQPDRGKVIVRERIAPLVAMGAGFHPDLTGYENIFLNGAIMGIPRSDLLKAAPAIIEFSELGSQIHHFVKTYSTGMMTRLGFSVAAFVNAPIMVLDEILSVGDEGFQRKCFKKMEELFFAGRTIIMVTHDPNQARRFCKRCIVLENGKIAFDGPMERGGEVYSEMFL